MPGRKRRCEDLAGCSDLEGEERRDRCPPENGRVHLAWRDEALQGDISLDLERYGHVEGDFKLPLPARFPIALQSRARSNSP